MAEQVHAVEQWAGIVMPLEKALPVILKIQDLVSTSAATSTFEATTARTYLKRWFSANF